VDIRRERSFATTVWIVAFSVVFLLAAHAGAQTLTGLVRVSGGVAAVASSEKSLQLDCPAGKQALSGGASLSGSAAGGQFLVESVPMGSPPTAWSIVARDMDGGGTIWGVTAAVWCADPPPGLEVVEGTTASDSFDKSDTISCPSGKVVVGGGGRIASATVTTAALSEMKPYPTQTWGAAGTEIYPDSNAWALVTSALCAAVEPPLLFRNNQVHASYWGTAQQYCPAGYLAIAGGAESTLSGGALSASIPWGTSTTLWIAEANNPGVEGGAWNLDARVLCFSTQVFADGFEVGSTGAWSATAW